MDWGPISEWAAAVAELLAVSVALFLPYYTEHRKEKRKIRNLRVAINHLSQQALAGEKDAVVTLEIFLNVSFLTTSSTEAEQLIVAGRLILDSIKALPDKHMESYSAAVQKINKLVAAVNTPKHHTFTKR
ncbi:MAG: hypothetical protein ABF743_05680 [Schleiferilactobacillus perolens]|jgi:hypothetical protein|uniref:hypothetical protein n=1 Tax=Schleiferilactobacillus perolens TaxID=100468 RepID=UPI0039E9DB2D